MICVDACNTDTVGQSVRSVITCGIVGVIKCRDRGSVFPASSSCGLFQPGQLKSSLLLDIMWLMQRASEGRLILSFYDLTFELLVSSLMNNCCRRGSEWGESTFFVQTFSFLTVALAPFDTGQRRNLLPHSLWQEIWGDILWKVMIWLIEWKVVRRSRAVCWKWLLVHRKWPFSA